MATPNKPTAEELALRRIPTTATIRAVGFVKAKPKDDEEEVDKLAEDKPEDKPEDKGGKEPEDKPEDKKTEDDGDGEMKLTLRFMNDVDIEYGGMSRYNADTEEWEYKTLVMRLNPDDHDSTFIDTHGAPVMKDHSDKREDVLGKIVKGSMRVEDEKEYRSLMGDVVLSQHSDLAKRIYAEIKDGIGTYASMYIHMSDQEIVEETEEMVVVTAKSWWAQNIGLVYQGAFPDAGAVGYSYNSNQEIDMDKDKNTGNDATAQAKIDAANARVAKAEFDSAVTKINAQLQTGGITKEQYDELHKAVMNANTAGTDVSKVAAEGIAACAKKNAETVKPDGDTVAHSTVQAKAKTGDTVENAKRSVRCNVMLQLARTGGEKKLKDAGIDCAREVEVIQEQRNSGELRHANGVAIPLTTLMAEKAAMSARQRGDFAKANDIAQFAAGNTTSSNFDGITTTDRLPSLFQEALRDDSAMADFMPRVVQLSNEAEFPLQDDTVSSTWVSGETTSDTASQRISTENRSLVFRTLEVVSTITRKAMSLVNAPAVYDITINDIIREFNEQIFKAQLTGTGAGQPRGIMNTAGIESINPAVTGSGTGRVLNPNWTVAQSYIYRVMGNLRSGSSVNPSTACFITTPAVINNMVTNFIDEGSGLTVAMMQPGSNMPTIAGYKVIPYTGLNDRQMIFGKPDQGTLGFFSNTVEVREDSDVGGGGVVLRSYWDADYTVARTEAFARTNIA